MVSSASVALTSQAHASTTIIIKRRKLTQRAAWVGSAHKVLVRKPEGKRQLNRTMRRYENIIIYLKRNMIEGYGLDPSASG
jgi:hypothetical protein